jgi:hypothetical protein
MPWAINRAAERPAANPPKAQEKEDPEPGMEIGLLKLSSIRC